MTQHRGSGAKQAKGPIRSYADLIVWQKAMDLAVEALVLADRFLDRERYVLRDQLHRSATSIPANIAEGHGRLPRADFVRHLSIARGSLSEFETLLKLAERVGRVAEGADKAALKLADETGP